MKFLLPDLVRDVPDFPKKGIVFKDITPFLSNPKAFDQALDMIQKKISGTPVDGIAGIEARGFVLAAPLAVRMNLPLILLRKPGKLPYQTVKEAYDLEYGQAELHMHVDAFHEGSKILLIDDVLATGGTMQAACKLIEKGKGTVVGCAFLIELGFLAGREKLGKYMIHSLQNYM